MGTDRGRVPRWLFLTLIVIAGGVLRFAYMETTMVISPANTGDAGQYVRYAENLIDYHTFSRGDDTDGPPVPDAYWAPGYPAFLAVVISAANMLDVDAYEAVLTLQMALGTLSILLTYWVALYCLPAWWALLPAALVAASPHLVATALYLLSETLTLFLLLASLLALLAGLARQQRALLLTAGCGFALSYLCNPVTLFIAPFALLTAWLAGGAARSSRSDAIAQQWDATALRYDVSTGRHSVRRAVTLVLVPLLLTAGLWAARGAISVPEGSTGAGDRLLTNLVQGMHSDFHAIWRANPRDPHNPATRDLAKVDGSYGAFAALWAEQARAQPGATAHWYLLDKPLLFWDWSIRVGAGDIYTYEVLFSLYHTSKPALVSYSVMRSLHLWLLACAVLSLVYLTKYREPGSWAPAVLYCALAYMTAAYSVAQSEPRYSFALRPELYTLAAYFLWRVARSIQQYRSRVAATAVSQV